MMNLKAGFKKNLTDGFYMRGNTSILGTPSNFSINILRKSILQIHLCSYIYVLQNRKFMSFPNVLFSLMEPEQNAEISFVSLRLILPAKFYI